ncbi:MAG: hypothetical protein RR495_02420 [Anaerovoracaceae bacterium]
MKLLGSKRGITMVEVIVGLVICLILMVAATAIFVPVTNSYSRAEDFSETQMIAKNLVNTIRGKTNGAAIIGVGANNSTLTYKIKATSNSKTIDSSPEGYLRIDGRLPYPPSYYKGRVIKLEFAPVSENKVKMNITIDYKDKPGRDYSKEILLTPTAAGFTVATGFNDYIAKCEEIIKEKFTGGYLDRKVIIDTLFATGYDVPKITINGVEMYWLPYYLGNKTAHEFVYFAGPAKNNNGWTGYALMVKGEIYYTKSGKAVGVSGLYAYAKADLLLQSDWFKNNFIK